MRRFLRRMGWLLLTAFIIGLPICLWPTNISAELKGALEAAKLKHSPYIKRQDYTLIIDYSKPVFKKRLWMLNQKGDVVLNSHVSHAWNSGFFWPTDFSNTVNSEKSCFGSFVTAGPYESKYGSGEYKIGMQLVGLEKGINNNAMQRAIVFHSHYWLWSQGCFMTLPETNKTIIDSTKNGCLLFVHSL